MVLYTFFVTLHLGLVQQAAFSSHQFFSLVILYNLILV